MVVTARSRAPRPENRPWFSITCHYRKLEIRANRTSPRGAPRKRNRQAATDSEQSRRAEHRWSGSPSAERQRTAGLHPKRHLAATCTNAPACISARSRRVFEPQTFPLPTSFSRFYAHLRAPARWRRVRRPGRGDEQDKTAPLLSRPGLHKRRTRRRLKRGITHLPESRARGRVLPRERPRKSTPHATGAFRAAACSASTGRPEWRRIIKNGENRGTGLSWQGGAARFVHIGPTHVGMDPVPERCRENLQRLPHACGESPSRGL